MHYFGKYIDTFEMAMQMLFIQKGYGQIKHLDAMGKRCFGFYNGTNGENYYIPVVEIEAAINAIARHMNLENRLTAKHLVGMEAVQACDEGGIVYGPVVEESIICQPANMYYHGKNRFFYIRRESENYYTITDPDGFPGVIYTKKELEHFFLAERGMTISLYKNDGVHGEEGNIEEIWNEGLSFYTKVVESVERTTAKKESFNDYIDISSKRIALWYGVMNYIQQIEKVRELHIQVKNMQTDDRTIRKLQSDMLKEAEKGKISALSEIEQTIWKEIVDGI